MNLLFKNTTKYTKNLYLNFLTFHNKIFGLRYHLFSFFGIAFFVIGIIMQLSYLLFVQALIFTAFLIIFVIYRYSFSTSKISKELKSKKMNDSEEINFCFYDDHFEVLNESTGVSLEYKKIYKVYDLPDLFYIYISKQYALLVDKNSFTIGNHLDFSDFLIKKCKRKYKEAQV